MPVIGVSTGLTPVFWPLMGTGWSSCEHMQEHQEALAASKAELEALLEERNNAELAATDAYCASVGQYQEQLDAGHSAEADAYDALRAKCARPWPPAWLEGAASYTKDLSCWWN